MALWLTKAELMARPTSGTGWAAVTEAAGKDWGPGDLSDQESTHNVMVLAGAYVATRTGSATMKRKVTNALAAIQGTEADGQVLSLGRKLAAYIVAADTVAYRDSRFVSWVDKVRNEQLANKLEPDGSTDSLVSRHESRANNWGACCGMSRVACDLYLGDKADLERAVTIWKGWLGDRASYSKFFYGPKGEWEGWSHNAAAPVPVNPKGATKDGHPFDGILPADQYRSGPYDKSVWPPATSVYPPGVAGFALVTVEMLRRNGYPQFHTLSDSAPRRILEWLVRVGKPLEGNDTWEPPLAKKLYPGIPLGAGNPRSKGAMAWCHWTHA